MHLKKDFKKKHFFTAKGAPCVQTKIFFLKYLFLGDFASKGGLTF
jgi:hypothetical protein